MLITEAPLSGCFIIEPVVYSDNRGLFFETYRKKVFEQAIEKNIDFVQHNYSVSKKGVLRGLHFQKTPYAQSKLVQVVKGEVLDVVVDLRMESNTFAHYIKLNLSAENKKMVFIPKGMAHGFLALSEEAVFVYKCDSYYNTSAESGIIYDDEDLKIDWNYPAEKIILSEKDKQLPTLKELYP